MSSFKRKSACKQPSLPIGTRISPSSPLTAVTSTGIPSLDDVLGGGLPLSCSLLVLAPDPHSAYGELVQMYFIAQGLACRQRLCVIDDDAKKLVKECMWMPTSDTSSPSRSVDEEEEKNASQHDEKIKIAWRYEQMKKFQTTVSFPTPSAEEYCRTLDLTCRIPERIVEDTIRSKELLCVDVTSAESGGAVSTWRIISQIEQILKTDRVAPGPLRICIPSLASPQWGDLRSQDILLFLHSLRSLLRQHPHSCAFISLTPHLCTDKWAGPGWTQKLGWFSDGGITLSAFTANPSLATAFPSHHGLLHIHTLPTPHTVLSLSDKFSTLRGLSATGENNLAFKCMRKRLIFETLHLDLEGGVGERRTTLSTNAMALDAGITLPTDSETRQGKPKTAVAAVEVQFETAEQVAPSAGTSLLGGSADPKVKKPKKKVAFQSDRPALYDF